MPRFELKQSTRHITSHAGLILVGQCLEAAKLELIDKKFPAPKGQMPTSDIVKRGSPHQTEKIVRLFE